MISVHLTHFGVGLPADLGFEPVADSDWWTLTLAVPEGRASSTSSGRRQLRHPPRRGPAQPDDGPPPLRRQLGVRGGRLRRPRVGAPATGSAGRTPGRPGARQPGARSPGRHDRLPPGGIRRPRRRRPVPAAGRPRRRRLPPLRVGCDGARQPDPPTADLAAHRGGASATRASGWSSTPTIRVTTPTSTDELVPRARGASCRWRPRRPARCLMGASFGAVASLVGRLRRRPGIFGRLLLQSGSFAGAGTGCRPRPERAVAAGRRRWSAGSSPTRAPVAERVFVSCGVYESLICENRGARAGARRTGHGGPLRRGPRRAQLGELARRPRRGAAVAVRPVTRRRSATCRAKPCYLRTWPTSPAASGCRWAPTSAGRSATRRCCERLDLALPIGRRHRALRGRAGDDRAVRPAPADAATTSSSTA